MHVLCLRHVTRGMSLRRACRVGPSETFACYGGRGGGGGPGELVLGRLEARRLLLEPRLKAPAPAHTHT